MPKGCTDHVIPIRNAINHIKKKKTAKQSLGHLLNL